ncbi:MAG: sigma-70 family RNA polymerase sigma factor [Chthoniobacterales bacterium]|jgi:DNA-directed RNA polymerase specialized sigma24 family protein|nr:sigma-70 family RNA polymerase sigma factor [Chthoniobacterales bacterium]MBA3762018.1 sigma-70 family RNA polymerase sigma factor [Chthoniobacterales bacterium]
MSFKFEEFVQENFAPAYRFAFCLSLAHDRATRLVDTTFQEAEALRKHNAQAKVDRTWVLETLHRKWRACHPVLPEADLDAGTTSEPLISLENAGEMDCDAVLKVLHSMSPAHRLVLSLFYFEKLGFNEIARILQLPPETALPSLARAKVLFRQLLEERRRASDTQLANLVLDHSG